MLPVPVLRCFELARSAYFGSLRGWGAAGGAGLLSVAFGLLSPNVAGAVPVEFADALQRTHYETLNGNVNDDGHPDIYLEAQQSVAILSIETLLLPVPLPAPSSTFLLLSRPDGSYRLIRNPASHLVDGTDWLSGNFDVHFGDTDGDGSVEMLVEARFDWSDSFLIGAETSSGRPIFVQQLRETDTGINLGAPGVAAVLDDVNDDGRADLVVYEDGLVIAVFVATVSGNFSFDEDNEVNSYASARLVWSAFCRALEDGDMSGALDYVVSSSLPFYHRALSGIVDLGGLPAQWSEPRRISATDKYAEYLVTQTLDGQTLHHVVVFKKEGERWRVLSL